MVSLTDENQAKVKFHLGYNYSVPPADYARVLNAMTTIPDDWTVTRIGELINRCEVAYANTAIDEGVIIDNERESFNGTEGAVVTQQTTLFGSRDTYNLRYRDYMNECRNLAITLGVRNYRDIESALDGW